MTNRLRDWSVPHGESVRSVQSTTCAGIVLLAAATLLYMTSPRTEAFFWTDAATFALNGELIRDYLASGFATSPMAFAKTWFLHYPALTISLYPPIFPLAEAVMFMAFGFSHAAAQATVAVFCLAAAGGAYASARTVAPPLAAAGAALLVLAAPEVLLWSRQVMMETPALAFLLLGSACLLRYQARGSTGWLLAATALVLAATYTKQTAIFAALAFAAAILADQGLPASRRRPLWIAAALGVVGLLPLAAFTLATASVLVDIALQTASAGSDLAAPTSPPMVLLYLRVLPDICGWPMLAASACYGAVVARQGWRDRAERRLAILMAAWFVSDLLFVSLVGHFEQRYGMALAVPAAMFSVLLALRVTAVRWRPAVSLGAGALALVATMIRSPVPPGASYAAVAAAVVQYAGKGDVVLFDLEDTKTLSFSLRARSPAPGPYVLRAEKLLVDYRIVREWGVQDRSLGTAEIEGIIDKFGIGLVVLQPGFWADLPSMARLEAILGSDRFEQVAEFAIESETASKRTTIKLLRNRRTAALTADAARQMLRD